jgi:hypothetical protein
MDWAFVTAFQQPAAHLANTYFRVLWVGALRTCMLTPSIAAVCYDSTPTHQLNRFINH